MCNQPISDFQGRANPRPCCTTIKKKMLYGKNQATPPKDVANKELVQILYLELRSAVFDKVNDTVPA